MARGPEHTTEFQAGHKQPASTYAQFLQAHGDVSANSNNAAALATKDLSTTRSLMSSQSANRSDMSASPAERFLATLTRLKADLQNPELMNDIFQNGNNEAASHLMQRIDNARDVAAQHKSLPQNVLSNVLALGGKSLAAQFEQAAQQKFTPKAQPTRGISQ
jgi:hypothetical protein